MDETPKQPKNNIFLPLFFALVMIGGMVIGLKMQDTTNIFERIHDNELGSHNNMEAPLMQVIRYIDSKYVDTLDQSAFAETAIRNLIKDLDPHSVYLPAKAFIRSKEQLSGSFVGIGIDFLMINDTMTIGGVIKDGPAFQAGLKSGDKILMVRDSMIAGVKMKADSVVALLKGVRGSSLKLTCQNRITKEKYQAEILRDDIGLPSVPAAFMIDQMTGYLKISSYTATTSREFAQAIKKLIEDEGMEDLIIDLRDNPGGYLNEAVEILNHIFLDKHKLLVYTKGAKTGTKDYESNGSSRLNIKKIAVLINEESASAAEITAGALQDWDRAVIIGRRSFGKGLVQEELQLVNGAIRMTVARYYTPSGRCIQKDYSDREDYAKDIENRFDNGEMYHEADNLSIDTTKYYTANRRLVHGGGGITPEFFIPLDSLLTDRNWLITNSMAYQFILSNPINLPGVDRDDFLENYQVADGLVNQFIAYTQKEHEFLQGNLDSYYQPFLKRTLKAYMGKLLFGEDMYYVVMASKKDPFVQKALKQLKKEDVFATD